MECEYRKMILELIDRINDQKILVLIYRFTKCLYYKNKKGDDTNA